MVAEPWSSRSSLITAYGTYLRQVRGLTEATCEGYLWYASGFLKARFRPGCVDFSTLHPSDVVGYISELATRYSPNTCKITATTLKSLFRWLAMDGRCPPRLADSVPAVSVRRLSDLPSALSESETAALLSSFDLDRPTGLRGHAAALCMVRLGLRVGEVARLKIEDIDWREGILQVVKGKGRRANVLPLPKEVGDAIVAYLQRGRPQTEDRHILAPHRRGRRDPTMRGRRDIIRADLYRAFKRAGVRIGRRGCTRVLRHTAATSLIQKGATLKEIADILGHRDLDTTGIYARVDLPTLRMVAMPWPGREQ